MSKTMKWAASIAIAALVVWAWLGRFDVVATTGSGQTGTYVVLDRWTGQASYCMAAKCFPANSN